MNPCRICEHFNEVQAEILRLKSGSDSSCQASLIMEYFTPLKHAADELKYEYGKMCFKNMPDSAFDE